MHYLESVPYLEGCALFREEIASLTAQVQMANKKYQELSQGQVKNLQGQVKSSQGQVKNANVLSALPEVINKKLYAVSWKCWCAIEVGGCLSAAKEKYFLCV